MPLIRSSASTRYAALVTLILSISKVMPSCSCCVEKGLVCIIIMSLSGRQPLSCAECIKVNMYLSYNVYFVSNVKYIYYFIFLNCLVPCLSYYRVLDLIRC